MFSLVHFMYRIYFTSYFYMWWQALSTQSISEPREPETLQKPEGAESPNCIYIEKQSGVVEIGSTTTKQATMMFHDHQPGMNAEVEHTDDPTRSVTEDPDVSFEKFFERPVFIHGLQWAVGTQPTVNLEPWKLWMQNTRVANRLNNFRNFRGRLHVKVVINGTPFHWGSLMVSYYPLPRTSRGVVNNVTHYETNTPTSGDIMRMSQRQHILLDPATSNGGEMIFPFFWDDDCFDLIGGDPEALGTMTIQGLARLRHATGTQSVGVSFYAWCEDVRLSTPTAVDMNGLTAQAGKIESDEHAEGPISKPAAILSSIAEKAATIPGIAPYALPVSQVSGVVSKAAKAMGFCKPTEVSDRKRVIINNGGDLATSDSLDTVSPLTFNTKHEVSPDPRFSGLHDTDELAIQNISKIESYIGGADWTTAQPGGIRVIGMPVTPFVGMVDNRTLPPTENVKTLAPCGFAAFPFKYWKGTVRIRVQIVASAYHKGRLLLEWDPVASATTVESQVQYTRVIDIAQERDFSFDVAWGSYRPALEVGYWDDMAVISAAAAPSASFLRHNGSFAVRILNPLVTPGDITDPVRIMLWVSCPDLEVHNPLDNKLLYCTYQPTAPEAINVQAQSGDIGDQEAPMNSPTGAPVIDYVGGNLDPKAALFLHGDPIESFRDRKSVV